jgi:aromatic ring-opening dioxygenase LigB subunit
VFAAIAPHGGIAIAEACSAEERDVALKTRAGMEELGRRFAAAQIDTVIVATPHNVHISNALGVIVASRIAGRLDGVTPPVELDIACDDELAWRVLESFGAAGLSAAGVSFGSNEPRTAVAPMDWGVLIPLWFMGGRNAKPAPLVVVTPARDLPASDHVTAGAAIATAAEMSDRRIALIASADHGHAHSKSGPYGYHPAAAQYDRLMTEAVSNNQLEDLTGFSRELVEDAKADSWWQVLILHGATLGAGRAPGADWKGELISYEAPTYFGMLTASYTPS